MENVVLTIFIGFAIVMVIAAIILGRRRPSSHQDTTSASDFDDFADTTSDHYQGHAGQSTGSDSSHGD